MNEARHDREVRKCIREGIYQKKENGVKYCTFYDPDERSQHRTHECRYKRHLIEVEKRVGELTERVTYFHCINTPKGFRKQLVLPLVKVEERE